MESKSDIQSAQVWDCGSSLYDSFELHCLKRGLDCAIISSTRALSMPHLSPPPPQPSPKKPSRISRSLQKLLRSVFRSPKPNSGSYQSQYVVYDKTGALTTIPEAPEMDHTPETNLLARRAASARFTVTSIGVSCA